MNKSKSRIEFREFIKKVEPECVVCGEPISSRGECECDYRKLGIIENSGLN